MMMSLFTEISVLFYLTWAYNPTFEIDPIIIRIKHEWCECKQGAGTVGERSNEGMKSGGGGGKSSDYH